MAIPYVVRKQFVFMCSPRQLSNLLDKIAVNSVNITGIQFNYTKCGYNVVLVVGPSTLNDGNATVYTTANNNVKIYLQDVGIKCYKYTDIIQILSNAIGIIRKLYNTIYPVTKIINSFYGESSRIFYSVYNIEAAKTALNNAI